MKNPNTFQLDLQNKAPQQMSGIDPMTILSLLLRNWYYFAITISITLFCARFYINHTMPLYRSSVSVLINETDDRQMMDNSQILQGLGLPGGMKSIENQVMVMKSRALTETTLKELPFEIEYYFKTIRNQLPIYPETPIKIVCDKEIPLPKDTEFSISYLGNNRFSLESEFYPIQKTTSFGENIELSGGSFTIECWNEEWLNQNKENKIYFTIHSRAGLINYYSSRLSVDLVSREGSILQISLVGTNRNKDVDFLNKHVENFQNISLARKNIEAERRIQFIDDQLVGISDSLSITENRLQQFRSSHKVMDLSAQGQAIIGQVTSLENEKARLTLEANYYDYLADYLAKESTDEIPLVPITMGITDPGITRLVNELSELQGQLSGTGAGEMNPLQKNLAQRVRSTKAALLETLNGLRRANSLARSENQDQILKANSQASLLPVTERQLLGIERKFSLNNELYTFLLETRAEQLMQKASNRADSEVIDPADARFSSMVSPNSGKIYTLGFLAGCGIPLVIIFLIFLFNNKIRDEEIRKMTDLPIIGNIQHSTEKRSTIVLANPDSSISEAFRLLRSRMQFFTKEANSPIILITSSIPGEGKTFTAINLASAYSLLEKKTILVGFDLRKPKIYQDFNLSNEKGISTWLIGNDKLDDIIQKTSFSNLSVISAGPIPPNPSELIALEKTTELLKLLKTKYDYIIIDSSPIGVVSDTLHLAPLVDACLLVVRSGHTLRNMLELTFKEIMNSEIKGASIVINDIKSDSKLYGYGEKYGYTHDKTKSRRFNKKKN